MRKYLFIIMMCAFLSSLAGKVSAQRYLPGQTGLELRLGGVDDFGRNVRHLRGNFQIGLALSRYNRNRSRWVFGADYVKKHYAYKKIAVPKEQFTAEAGCLFPFLSDRGRNVFLSAGLSALAGYERVNRNGRLLYGDPAAQGCLHLRLRPGIRDGGVPDRPLGFSFQCPAACLLRIVRRAFPYGSGRRTEIYHRLIF